MPKNKVETVDYASVSRGHLKSARSQLAALGHNLETTATLASDLIKIRQLRLIIDDCKRRLGEAA